jgi:AcrR family transcriptional regulator
MGADAMKRKYGDGREALLAAVVDVVAEAGLAGMSYRKVAERAGVANTLITHHFGTREALLEAAMEWATQQTLDLVDMASDAAYDEHFAIDFVSKIAEEPQLQFFQYEMVLAARHQPQMKATVERLYGHYMDVMSQGFARRGFPQPDLLARVLFAATDGLVIQQLTYAGKKDIEQAFILLGQMLRGLPSDGVRATHALCGCSRDTTVG